MIDVSVQRDWVDYVTVIINIMIAFLALFSPVISEKYKKSKRRKEFKKIIPSLYNYLLKVYQNKDDIQWEAAINNKDKYYDLYREFLDDDTLKLINGTCTNFYNPYTNKSISIKTILKNYPNIKDRFRDLLKVLNDKYNCEEIKWDEL